MSLTLTLDPHDEELVAAHLRSGRYRSPQEVVIHAQETLAEQEASTEPVRMMTPSEAVSDIRELRRGITLGGLRIKDLIEEGRKS